eukprot:scaffold15445_cov221-Alexandrium_tamarense.AAC.7
MTTSNPPPTSNHTIALPDGTTHRYHLRGLSNTNDIDRWTTFCSSIFSYKPNPPPPSYFARHFHNDPKKDASLVRVLVYCPTSTGSGSVDCDEEEKNGEIVASVRIFRRTLSLGTCGDNCGGDSSVIEAGGIGEVCTSPNHQRRGLSKILLKDALSIMQSTMTCSFLHASPDFRTVYSKVGCYESVVSHWSVTSVYLNQLTTIDLNSDWILRRAEFPKDTTQLHALHQKYSEEKFITVTRSEQYWNEYVSAELGDTLWVLTKSSGAALNQAGEEIGSDRRDFISVELALPTFAVDEIREEAEERDGFTTQFIDLENAQTENDEGWMYVQFDEKEPSVLEMTKREEKPVYHLIWPTDSF